MKTSKTAFCRVYLYLPVFVFKQLQDYADDGISEFGMKKMHLIGKLIEKAIASDLLEVYKPASERMSNAPKPPIAKTEKPEPMPEAEKPEPMPEWKEKAFAWLEKQKAKKAEQVASKLPAS